VPVLTPYGSRLLVMNPSRPGRKSVPASRQRSMQR
jgi:hypothetical protein